MKWFKIDGKEWNVNVIEISESFSILYSENTGRTMAKGAPLTLDPLGTFWGHKMVVGRKRGEVNDFDKLFNYIAIPRYDGMTVVLPHDQKTMQYKAYVSTGERKVKRIIEEVDGEIKEVIYDTYPINFIATEAQVLPE